MMAWKVFTEGRDREKGFGILKVKLLTAISGQRFADLLYTQHDLRVTCSHGCFNRLTMLLYTAH